MRPGWTHQLDTPHRAAHVKRLLGSHERRRLTVEDPYVRVRRLLADERRDHAAQAADLHFQHIVRRFTSRSAGRKSVLPCRAQRQLDETRRRRRRDERERLRQRLRPHIFQQRQREAVGNVRREAHMLTLGLRLAVIVGIVYDGLAARGVDRHVQRLWKRRAFLNQVIGQKPELLPLRVDSGLIVERAVLEMKRQPRRHARTARDLDQIAVGDGRAVERPKREESVDDAFRVSDWYGFGRCDCSSAQYSQSEYVIAHEITGISMGNALADRGRQWIAWLWCGKKEGLRLGRLRTSGMISNGVSHNSPCPRRRSLLFGSTSSDLPIHCSRR